MNDFVNEIKWPVAFTLIVLILGTAGYFGLSNYANVKMENATMSANPLDKDAFESVRLKAAYSPEGFVKLFAYTPKLGYDSVEGENTPTDGRMIIGFMEAKMMKDEKLITGSGDKLENLFGLNITVGGILKKTDGLSDDLHFVSASDFEKVQGDEIAFVRLKDGAPKLFYTLDENANASFKFEIISGSLDNYKEYELAGRKYYPVLLGAKEAKMMLDEKLFAKPGDALSNFFGKDIIIAGILAETNTSLDMMHITTLRAIDI